MVTPPAAVAVLCALVVGIVAAGCAAPPRAGTTPAETAPAASAPPSAQAWAPQPWTPDFSRPPAKAIAPSATTPPIPVPDPKRDAREEILRRYEGAWKAMLAKRNGVRVADVEKGVSITKEWIDETATGAWFRVTYTASLDWAKVEAKDSFVVKVDAANPLAPRAPDLVGRWLSAAEVASFAERAPATAKLANVAFGKHLKFDSEIEALSALAKLPGRRVGGGKPAYELAMKGAARGHILLYTNVFVGDNFCAAWVIDLVTAKSCRASPHSCADDLDITAPFPSDRNGPPDHECTQP
jgi:hypothetical protein